MGGFLCDGQRLSSEVPNSFSNLVAWSSLRKNMVREARVCVVSLSFLNLFCVNLNFGIKLHGAAGLGSPASWRTDVLLARDSYAGASH